MWFDRVMCGSVGVGKRRVFQETDDPYLWVYFTTERHGTGVAVYPNWGICKFEQRFYQIEPMINCWSDYPMALIQIYLMVVQLCNARIEAYLLSWGAHLKRCYQVTDTESAYTSLKWRYVRLHYSHHFLTDWS